jgi:predicted DsbA family dithiol-disulfide isomerase
MNIDGTAARGQIRRPMPAPVRFFYDFVDPGSLLVDRILDEVEATHPRIERIPFEVTPPPEPLVDPRSDAWRRFWEGARAMSAEEGVQLAQPRIVPWTRKAHELAAHALEHDRADQVRRALFAAFLLDGRDLGRVDVLLDVALKHGLDLTATKAVLDVDRHTDAILQARADAERVGIRGVPTLLSEHGRLEGFRGRGATLAFLGAAAR